jgi:hypothetical protein
VIATGWKKLFFGGAAVGEGVVVAHIVFFEI